MDSVRCCFFMSTNVLIYVHKYYYILVRSMLPYPPFIKQLLRLLLDNQPFHLLLILLPVLNESLVLFKVVLLATRGIRTSQPL